MRFGTARPAAAIPLFLAYAVLCHLVLSRWDYLPPTMLTFTVEGPSPNSYRLFYEYVKEGRTVTERQQFSVGRNQGAAEVSFLLPDAEVRRVSLICGYKAGKITLRRIRRTGPFGDRSWGPAEIARQFLPGADADIDRVEATPEAFSFRTEGRWPALEYAATDFARTDGPSVRPGLNAFVPLALLGMVFALAFRNPWRLGAWLLFVLLVCSYVGLVGGVNNLSIVLSGGFLLMMMVEAALARSRLALILCGLCLGLTAVELALAVREPILGSRPVVEYVTTEGFWSRADAELGVRPASSHEWDVRLVLNGEVVAGPATVTTDAKGRRATPVEPSARKHAIFVGCSYTWGYGLADEQTVAAYFGRAAAGEYQPYNYSFNAWGTSQLLQLLRSGQELEDIHQEEGVLVYGFIGDHVYRTTPLLTAERADFPVFGLDPGGALDGPFRINERPRLWALYRYFGKPDGLLFRTSPLIRFVTGLPGFPVSRLDRVKATALVVTRAKQLYDSRFRGEFYVLVWEKQDLSDDEFETFSTMLETAGVRVLVVPRMPVPEEEFIHRFDRHPSRQRNRWVAEYLHGELARNSVRQPER